MAEKRLGTLITLIAGIAWGLSGVSGQYLIGRGMSVQLITSMRLMVSGLVLLGLCAVTARRNLLVLLKNGRAVI
ncbi:TPA: EamA family transporter, partial [Streptococcus suis]|nr:EamA family transporter [Streptococcus suis]